MTQTLNYQSPQPRRPAVRRLPLVLAAIGFLSLFAMILLPRPRYGESSVRVKSASNLRQIGQAILMYTNENAGAYPPDFATLLMTEDVTAEVFVSPMSNDTAAVGPTTRAIAAQLPTAGHCSYVYVGRGWNANTVSADAVVAYEPPTAAGTGSNTLFGDGHVEYCRPAWTKKLLAKLATRPSTSTQPVVMMP